MMLGFYLGISIMNSLTTIQSDVSALIDFLIDEMFMQILSNQQALRAPQRRKMKIQSLSYTLLFIDCACGLKFRRNLRKHL